MVKKRKLRTISLVDVQLTSHLMQPEELHVQMRRPFTPLQFTKTSKSMSLFYNDVIAISAGLPWINLVAKSKSKRF